MSIFPNSPRLKGGLILINPETAIVQQLSRLITTRTRSAARSKCRVLEKAAIGLTPFV